VLAEHAKVSADFVERQQGGVRHRKDGTPPDPPVRSIAGSVARAGSLPQAPCMAP
jgi:hypothetical protein